MTGRTSRSGPLQGTRLLLTLMLPLPFTAISAAPVYHYPVAETSPEAPAGEQAATESAQHSGAPRPGARKPKAPLPAFTPSEKISADKAVPFPADI